MRVLSPRLDVSALYALSAVYATAVLLSGLNEEWDPRSPQTVVMTRWLTKPLTQEVAESQVFADHWAHLWATVGARTTTRKALRTTKTSHECRRN
jgi:hypothetical protein